VSAFSNPFVEFFWIIGGSIFSTQLRKKPGKGGKVVRKVEKDIGDLET
jgi:hypothetical protein